MYLIFPEHPGIQGALRPLLISDKGVNVSQNYLNVESPLGKCVCALYINEGGEGAGSQLWIRRDILFSQKVDRYGIKIRHLL